MLKKMDIRQFFISALLAALVAAPYAFSQETQTSINAAPQSIKAAVDGKSVQEQGSVPAATTVSAPVPKSPPKHTEPALPPGFDAAMKAFNQHQYASATKQFESFINGGNNNVKIHNYLAQCYYKSRKYSKAIKQFEWLANNCKSDAALQAYGTSSAYFLKCEMSGVCPGNCVKDNDPRWKDGAMRFNFSHVIDVNGQKVTWWQYHKNIVGHTLTMNADGFPVVGDICPICNGTGRVRVLKDGDALN